jgi:hypothetical protein
MIFVVIILVHILHYRLQIIVQLLADRIIIIIYILLMITERVLDHTPHPRESAAAGQMETAALERARHCHLR